MDLPHAGHPVLEFNTDHALISSATHTLPGRPRRNCLKANKLARGRLDRVHTSEFSERGVLARVCAIIKGHLWVILYICLQALRYILAVVKQNMTREREAFARLCRVPTIVVIRRLTFFDDINVPCQRPAHKDTESAAVHCILSRTEVS